MILPKLLLELWFICIGAIVGWQVLIITMQILYCIGWSIVKAFQFLVKVFQFFIRLKYKL